MFLVNKIFFMKIPFIDNFYKKYFHGEPIRNHYKNKF